MALEEGSGNLLSKIVGVWKNDGVEIIANDQGNRTTPSYVAFTDTERVSDVFSMIRCSIAPKP